MDKEGMTPLHHAAMNGDVEAGSLLVNAGANRLAAISICMHPMRREALTQASLATRTSVDLQKRTPMHLACQVSCYTRTW